MVQYFKIVIYIYYTMLLCQTTKMQKIALFAMAIWYIIMYTQSQLHLSKQFGR